ncbi:MAG: flavodoxin family protein [Methanobrevibacter sp.]
MKSLIVFYSRTNVTRKLAEDIAGRLNADIEEIVPKVNYQGKIGYARGGKDAITEKIIDLEPLKYDPQDYDMVYLGTPVWAGKSSTPLISYIKHNEGKFTNVKFFATAGGSGLDSTLEQIEKYVSVKPSSTLALTTKEVKKDLYEDKLTEFLR